MPRIFPVILSGGAGTRLWPLSRELYPKQFHRLGGEHTLFQETLLRVSGPQFSPPVIVCNQEHRFIVNHQLREIGIVPEAVIVEPEGRNTAPAAAIAALLLENRPDALLLMMPSDQVVTDIKKFHAAAAQAEKLADGGALVTFGVAPESPHTGYGYIRRGAASAVMPGAYEVAGFVEKPDAATAESYLQSGDYYWNSGMFMFAPPVYLKALAGLQPGMLDLCRAALAGAKEDLFFRRLSEEFLQIKGDSIDYAVMEHVSHSAVVPVSMGWSDAGTWSSLWETSEKNAEGNCMVGDTLAVATSNTYIRSDDCLVAAVGVRDMIIVATKDVVLVADRKHDQAIKGIVEQLRRDNRRESHTPPVMIRPWGWAKSIDEGPRFHVKQIQIDPGGKLSLQKHWHRSEHWIVVTGTALITRGEESFLLRENESTYIPAGTVHRLENPGKVPLRMIEVQSGEYLEEDDIIRMEDAYGRAG
ncbi:MAG: mannose-1-phosphate guanylyltransferase/mannose-6-phosphate isomerase [Alphaproteobacteria bacterium]